MPGRVEGDTIEAQPLFVRRGEELVRIAGEPPRPERFERAGIDLARVSGGVD